MKKELIVGLIFVLAISFALAAHTITITDGVAFSFDEGADSFYDISVENTNPDSITQVDIAIPDSFSYITESSSTDSNGTFSDAAEVLTWSGDDGIIANTETKSFSFNLNASVPGIYDLIITTTDASGSLESIIPVEINDILFPLITPNVPVENGGISGTTNLSATISDSGVIDSVSFNMVSSNGGVIDSSNNTGRKFTASNLTNKETWIASIITTDFFEGYYNISIQANDSIGHISNSVVTNFIIDNTHPNITFDCDDFSVDKGVEINCECNGTDSLSGVESIDFDEHPSTSSAGDGKITTCTITDRAGNSVSQNFTYDVNEDDSGGDSGSDDGGDSSSDDDDDSSSSDNSVARSAFWVTTYNEGDEELKDKETIKKTLGVKQRVRVSINDTTYYVGITELDDEEAVMNISSETAEKIFKINDSFKFDVNDDNTYDMEVILEAISLIGGINRANVTINYINEATGDEITSGLITGRTGDETGIKLGGRIASTGKAIWGKFSNPGPGKFLWIGGVLGVILIGGAVGFFVYKKKNNISSHVTKSDWR